jgi:integrase
MKAKYNLKIKNFSSHSMRKCFGREIINRSGENAEMALTKLSQLFNHSNPAITRRYLGIAKEELFQKA